MKSALQFIDDYENDYDGVIKLIKESESSIEISEKLNKLGYDISTEDVNYCVNLLNSDEQDSDVELQPEALASVAGGSAKQKTQQPIINDKLAKKLAKDLKNSETLKKLNNYQPKPKYIKF